MCFARSGHSLAVEMKKTDSARGSAKQVGPAPARSPAVYRIVVAGRVGPNWRNRLGAMQCSLQESPNGATTVLEGPIRDRAELTGILNTLYDLHLTLLRVEVL